jgi:hypothetical protein
MLPNGSMIGTIYIQLNKFSGFIKVVYLHGPCSKTVHLGLSEELGSWLFVKSVNLFTLLKILTDYVATFELPSFTKIT